VSGARDATRATDAPTRQDLARAVALAPRYDRPGPRYTSYPPAPHFTEAVGPAEAAALYGARGAGSPPLSIYVHLPFCEAMCRYCACNVIVSKDAAIVDRYLATLEREVDLAAGRLSSGPMDVVQLHLGGGTPTFFPPEALERLHGVLASRFRIVLGAEMAIEVDPRVTTRAHVETLARLGWRRMSMGVQDFDPVVQVAIDRVQSEDETAALVEHARASGFTSIHVDLVYGLPHQTLDGFRRTLRAVLDRLDPDRASLFGYAHVPWLKSHQRRVDESALPRGPERLALFHAGVEAFVGRGYEFLGLDHFAKPQDDLAVARRRGELRRNFMGFHAHAGTDMVAFGVTGIGDVGGTYLQNRHTLSGWEKDVAEGRLPVERGYRRTDDDVRRGAVIQALMCSGAAPASLLGGADWAVAWPKEAAALAPMAEDGLLVADEAGVRLTPLGRLFVRNACMVFDAHLGHAPASPARRRDASRYSRTV
jgi:oxygen-independent coproporphyrinogen-3 oxidase